jgi:hypothetical protein
MDGVEIVGIVKVGHSQVSNSESVSRDLSAMLVVLMRNSLW